MRICDENAPDLPGSGNEYCFWSAHKLVRLFSIFCCLCGDNLNKFPVSNKFFWYFKLIITIRLSYFKQVDVELDPPIFTMKSVHNEKTEPEQARKQKTSQEIGNVCVCQNECVCLCVCKNVSVCL